MPYGTMLELNPECMSLVNMETCLGQSQLEPSNLCINGCAAYLLVLDQELTDM